MQVPHRTGKGQQCLFLTGNYFRASPRLDFTEKLFGHVEKLAVVLCITSGRGGDHAHALDLFKLHLFDVTFERYAGPRKRFRIKLTGSIDALAKADDLHRAGNIPDLAILLNLADEQANGVGSAVDSSDASHRASLSLNRR